MNWYKRFTSKVFYLITRKHNAPELSRFGIENVSVFENTSTGLGRVKLNTLLGILVTTYHKLRKLWIFIN